MRKLAQFKYWKSEPSHNFLHFRLCTPVASRAPIECISKHVPRRPHTSHKRLVGFHIPHSNCLSDALAQDQCPLVEQPKVEMPLLQSQVSLCGLARPLRVFCLSVISEQLRIGDSELAHGTNFSALCILRAYDSLHSPLPAA